MIPAQVQDTTELGAWLQLHGLAVLILAIAALVAFSLVQPIVHRIIAGIVNRRIPARDLGTPSTDEVRKRIATIEDLVSRVLRAAVILIAVLVVLAIFDLFPVVAGLGIAFAALTLAGQSIVLDYLMGVLILVEGPYFKGDWIQIGGVEGEVEEIGLRRTVLRDRSGTVHSVSNGQVRVASNLTRVYAVLQVDVTLDPGADTDRATEVVDGVGREMADDLAWAGRLLEPPHVLEADALDPGGPTLRVTGRVRAADRWAAPAELRRRIALALRSSGEEPAGRHPEDEAGREERENEEHGHGEHGHGERGHEGPADST